MKIKCLLGMHKWQKVGGLHKVGGAKFEQMWRCSNCGKVKYTVS